MLPFLKKHRVASVIVSHRKPDENVEKPEISELDQGLEAAARDLCDAVSFGNHKAVASALKAAFEILDASPHEEGEHTNDFDSQNIKAAREARE